ncbi:MAG: helix-turn-helix domain-containing protein [Acidimicrobiales bacterium]
MGDRLRSVRLQQRLSLQAVEAASHEEFKASVLGAYERGERAISVPRLQRLARFYNVPVDQLLPRDPGPEGRADRGQGDVPADARRDDEGVTIDLTQLDIASSAESQALGRYLSTIQVQRQDFNGRVLTVRREDVRALAALFDVPPDEVRRRLEEMRAHHRR